MGLRDTRLAVGTEMVDMRRIDYLNDPTAPKANSIVVATSAYVENDDGRILLIRRTDNGLWSLPGGGMEPGETVIGCAVREVKEETGIDVEVTGLVGIFSNPGHVVAYPDGEVRQGFSICVSARPVAGSCAYERRVEPRSPGFPAMSSLNATCILRSAAESSGPLPTTRGPTSTELRLARAEPLFGVPLRSAPAGQAQRTPSRHRQDRTARRSPPIAPRQ